MAREQGFQSPGGNKNSKEKERKPNPAAKDFYDRLGVPREATAREIKTAHRRFVKEHHSDRNNNGDQEALKRINEAYDAVKTKANRAKHDSRYPFDPELDIRRRQREVNEKRGDEEKKRTEAAAEAQRKSEEAATAGAHTERAQRQEEADKRSAKPKFDADAEAQRREAEAAAATFTGREDPFGWEMGEDLASAVKSGEKTRAEELRKKGIQDQEEPEPEPEVKSESARSSGPNSEGAKSGGNKAREENKAGGGEKREERAEGPRDAREGTYAERKRKLEEAIAGLMAKEEAARARGAKARENVSKKYDSSKVNPDSPRAEKWPRTPADEAKLKEGYATYEKSLQDYEKLREAFFKTKGDEIRRSGSVANFGAMFKRDWSDLSPEIRKARAGYEFASERLVRESEKFADERLKTKSPEEYREMYKRQVVGEARKEARAEAREEGIRQGLADDALKTFINEAESKANIPTFDENSADFKTGVEAYVQDYQTRAAERYRGLVTNREIIRNAGVGERRTLAAAFQTREQGGIERTLGAAAGWYQKQSVTKKVLLGAGVTLAFGAGGLALGAAAGAAVGTVAFWTLGIRAGARAAAVGVGLVSGMTTALNKGFKKVGDAAGRLTGEKIATLFGAMSREEATKRLGDTATRDAKLRERNEGRVAMRRARQEEIDLLSANEKIELAEQAVSVGVRTAGGVAAGVATGLASYEGLKFGLEKMGFDLGAIGAVSPPVEKATEDAGLSQPTAPESVAPADAGAPGAPGGESVSPSGTPNATYPFETQGGGAPPPPDNLPLGGVDGAPPDINAAASSSQGESVTVPGNVPPPDGGGTAPVAEGPAGPATPPEADAVDQTPFGPADAEHIEIKPTEVVVTDAHLHGGPHNAINALKALKVQLEGAGYDVSNAPAVVKHLLETSPEDLAKETGFYHPDKILDSGIVHAGDKFAFTDQGEFKFIGADGKEIVFAHETPLENIPETKLPDGYGLRREFESTGQTFEGKFQHTAPLPPLEQVEVTNPPVFRPMPLVNDTPPPLDAAPENIPASSAGAEDAQPVEGEPASAADAVQPQAESQTGRAPAAEGPAPQAEFLTNMKGVPYYPNEPHLYTMHDAEGNAHIGAWGGGKEALDKFAQDQAVKFGEIVYVDRTYTNLLGQVVPRSVGFIPENESIPKFTTSIDPAFVPGPERFDANVEAK